ncbi:hypothetical protein PM3016_5436 [Paenibacillus mucilaginosus 3016]|uniref:DUF3277 domain-containing protein n=1 Tax=Paenibacillus mucilaginosus 3016 TaxID=1116391 RepID=H6NDT7_9BACL|nr:phage protein [Paenibacillus mucilaginosus]AFC32136.1 hypothetical protein PM3016_5436 [Paenibacillus mucilaginosus 3016]WFA20639.1 DUF3277 family protein [Paenibacillus mucilaginosus]
MKNVSTFNAKDVAITVNNIFLTGVAEDSFVTASKDEDEFTTSVGAQGDVSVSEVNNPLGTITVTLQQSSPYVEYLNRLAVSKTMVPIWVFYNGRPKEKIGGTQARIKRPAAVNYSDDATDSNRSFEFQVFDYTQ